MSKKYRNLLLAALFSTVLAAKALDPIAMVSDPPPAIDGSVERLSRLNGQHILTPENSAVYGKDALQNDEDLSANVILGYDHTYLYVGTTVKDDHVVQNFTQSKIWKGDHVMLVLQYPYLPNATKEENLYVLCISPGNFDTIVPEAWFFRPGLISAKGIRVASRKEENGYRLEAAIPWTTLGASAPAVHDRLRYDVLVSDSDTGDQDSMIAVSPIASSPRPWAIPRLREGVFARADGTYDPGSVKQNELWSTEEGRLSKGETVKIAIPDEVAAKAKAMNVSMILDFPKFGGGSHGASLSFNGTALTNEHCLNRDKEIRFEAHQIGSCSSSNVWYTAYGQLDCKGYPTFYSNSLEINPAEFMFDISKLVSQDGPNELTITHYGQAEPDLLYKLSFSEYLIPANRLVLKDAPSGEIPSFTANAHKPNGSFYDASITDNGAVSVSVNDHSYQVTSEFSTLTPGWARFGTAGEGSVTIDGDSALLQTENFTVKRTIEKHDSYITVKDAVSNISGEELPLMYHHTVAVSTEKIFVSGYQKLSDNSINSTPSRPTSLALEDKSGIGLVAEDDFTRIQGYQFSKGKNIGLANERLLLTPGKTVELEYSIFPLDIPDQYVFINRIRDAWNVNFTIEGGWLFLSNFKTKTAQDLSNQSKLTGSKYCSISMPYDYSRKMGPAHHGNRYTQIDLSPLKTRTQFIHDAVPDMKVLTYYHCFISDGDGDIERYKDEAVIMPNGEIADYGTGYPIFIPLKGSDFAAMQDKVIDLRFDQGVDAIYWDELEYSKSMFSYSDKYWDGCTAEIDIRSHKVIRKITSVPIITEEWRLDLIKRLIERGNGVFVANGAPFTRRMRQLFFPRFIETGSLSNLVLGQLYSPLSLGDHLTVRTELDEYNDMLKALKYGCVYYHYPDIVPTKTAFSAYMFPMTPKALGNGFIIGKERILTAVSGYFSWNDNSDFKAYVFNRIGDIVPDFKIPKIQRNGITYAEVRIPEGYGVALIRVDN